MSSTPFCLGLPVVDDLPSESGSYVLRTKDQKELAEKIRNLQDRLTVKDLIKIYFIGFRPDVPVPVSRYFAEICIEIGGAEERHNMYGYWDASCYHRIATGRRVEVNADS